MTKEDVQLTCPIGYDDPLNVWNLLDKDLVSKFPLEKLVWKNPINQLDVTVDKLPLRCMPMTANLFKDTDHPFRWFLAPYVNIYILVCEGMDVYKTNKPKLKAWVESHGGLRRTSWIIIYLPMGSQSMEVYQRIYNKLSSDFHVDKAGDKSVMLLLSGFRNPAANFSLQQNSLNDLIEKIKDSVVASFQQRLTLYDSEVRRLNALRNTPLADFKQLFLVRESLALLFQMMQLPLDALTQYEELKLLLENTTPTTLPFSYWPLVAVDNLKPSKEDKNTTNIDNTNNSTSGVSGNSSEKFTSLPSKTVMIETWVDPIMLGEGVMSYSINNVRMKVLRNKIGLLELQKYIFARICFFQMNHGKGHLCAELGLAFITESRLALQKRYDNKSVSLPNESTLTSSTIIPDTADTSTNKDGTTIEPPSSPTSPIAMPIDTLRKANMTTEELLVLIDVWCLTSAMSVTKYCQHYFPTHPTERDTATGNHFLVQLCELLRFASSALQRIMMTTTCTLRGSGSQCIDLVHTLTSWDAFEALVSRYPEILLTAAAPPHNNTIVTTSSSSSAIERNPLSSGADMFISELGSNLKRMMEVQEQMKYETTSTTTATSHDESTVSSSSGSSGNSDSSRSRLPVIEANLMSGLGKLLAEYEESAGRFRFSWRTRLQCADVLICSGQFSQARQVLLTALEATEKMLSTRTLRRDSTLTSPAPHTLTRAIARSVSAELPPPLPLPSSSSPEPIDNTSPSPALDSTPTSSLFTESQETYSHWKEIRFWLLRKIQFCSRALHDVEGYIHAAIMLLKPDLSVDSPLNKSLREAICRDIILLQQGDIYDEMDQLVTTPSPSAITYSTNASTTLPLPPPLPVKVPEFHIPLRPLIEACLTLLPGASTDTASRSATSSGKVTKLVRATKVIEEDHFQVRLMRCVGGEHHEGLVLRLLSKLPVAVTIDDITVSYGPFATVILASHLQFPHTVSSSASEGVGGFQCQYKDNDNNNIVLIPDILLTIPLTFDTPTVNEFIPVLIAVRIGNIILEDRVPSDVKELHRFFADYCLVSAISPTNAITITPTSPKYTPVGQKDLVQLKLACMEDDVDSLSDIKIRASSQQVGSTEPHSPVSPAPFFSPGKTMTTSSDVIPGVGINAISETFPTSMDTSSSPGRNRDKTASQNKSNRINTTHVENLASSSTSTITTGSNNTAAIPPLSIDCACKVYPTKEWQMILNNNNNTNSPTTTNSSLSEGYVKYEMDQLTISHLGRVGSEGTKKGGELSTLPSSSEVVIPKSVTFNIPFSIDEIDVDTTTATTTTTNIPLSNNYCITFLVSGTLWRRNCRIEFDIQAHCVVTGGMPLLTSCKLLPSFNNFSMDPITSTVYFGQVTLVNNTPMTWRIPRVNFTDSLKTKLGDKYKIVKILEGLTELVPYDSKDFNSHNLSSSNNSHNSKYSVFSTLDVILLPGEEYGLSFIVQIFNEEQRQKKKNEHKGVVTKASDGATLSLEESINNPLGIKAKDGYTVTFDLFRADNVTTTTTTTNSILTPYEVTNDDKENSWNDSMYHHHCPFQLPCTLPLPALNRLEILEGGLANLLTVQITVTSSLTPFNNITNSNRGTTTSTNSNSNNSYTVGSPLYCSYEIHIIPSVSPVYQQDEGFNTSNLSLLLTIQSSSVWEAIGMISKSITLSTEKMSPTTATTTGNMKERNEDLNSNTSSSIIKTVHMEFLLVPLESGLLSLPPVLVSHKPRPSSTSIELLSPMVAYSGMKLPVDGFMTDRIKRSTTTSAVPLRLPEAIVA